MVELSRGRYYVTVGGAEKLQREMEQLQEKRSELSGNIRTAKGFGDLSENFEYHEAKREQGMLEGRLQQLKIILPSLEIVRPESVSTEQVGFGAVVTVDDDGERWDLQIVGPLEADPMDDRISYESPLGSALLGRRVGEQVEVEVPAGTVRYEIVEIRAYTV